MKKILQNKIKIAIFSSIVLGFFAFSILFFPKIKDIPSTLGESTQKEVETILWKNFEYNKSAEPDISAAVKDGITPNKYIFGMEEGTEPIASIYKYSISDDKYTDIEYTYDVENNSIVFSTTNSEDEKIVVYYNDTNFDNSKITINDLDSSFVEIKGAPISIAVDRKWALTGTESFKENAKVKFNLTTESSSHYKNFYVEVDDSNYEQELVETSPNNFEVEIDTNLLSPGEKTVHAVIIDNDGNIFKTYNLQFNVSYPVYVAWTIDWEGYDSSNQTLELINNLSNKYDIPIVHMWNPRAHYILSENRLNELLTWLRNREQNNRDEIGLHLHMYFDMIKRIGIQEIIKSPSWDSRGTGSDVPQYAYSYEDQLKMFKWAIEQFKEQGLATPTIYRSGGWMADSNTLKALAATGFKIDSSGRSTDFSLGKYLVKYNTPQDTNEEEKTDPVTRSATKEEIIKYKDTQNQIEQTGSGSLIFSDEEGQSYTFIQEAVEGKWDLNVNTQPYLPSSTDINASGSAPIGIWEFPNNGEESWRMNTTQLIKNFEANYSGGTVNDAVVVTYLSHPHSISVDMQKLEPLYAHIDKNSITSDNGPVVYANFSEIYLDITGNQL